MALKVCDGNHAAAYGVLLARPDVVAPYPITPQTPLVEQLARFHAEGLLDCEMIEVEGENSALSAVMGATVAGGRVFTATSSWGLAFMYDCLMFCAGHRVPVVMANINREMPFVLSVANGRQDIMCIRDVGWIQIEAETCQEILDDIILAYRLAEDAEVLLPVVVSYDGFYLSHLAERVEVPEQEAVDTFLAPVAETSRLKLVPGEPMCFASLAMEELFTEYRYKHCAALERAKTKFEAIEREFERIFGRNHGGLVDTYRVEDAELVLVTAGSCAGTARVVIDNAREAGQKVGLVRIRMFRPFPREKLGHVLRDKKAIAVVDRSVCLGWNCGHLLMELRAALPGIADTVPVLNFIDGLANADITREHLEQVVDITYQALEGKQVPEVTWLALQSRR